MPEEAPPSPASGGPDPRRGLGPDLLPANPAADARVLRAAPWGGGGEEFGAAPPGRGLTRQLWETVFHYRRMAAAIILGAVIIGAAIAYTTKKFYLADGSLILARPSAQLAEIHPTSDYTSADEDREMQTQLTILGSRAVAVRTIAHLRLETRMPAIHRVLAGINAQLAPRHIVLNPATAREIAAGIFLSRLKLLPDKLSSTVHVQFGSHDPKLAAAVVNGLMASYLAYLADGRAAQGREIGVWLDGELAHARARVGADNAALVAFQQAHRYTPLLVPGGEQSVLLERLDLANRELAAAQADTILNRALNSAYQGDVGALPGDLRTPAMDAATTALNAARANYDALSATYQSNFAPVQVARAEWLAAQRRVAALRAQLSQELQRRELAASSRQAALTTQLGDLRQSAANESAVEIQYAALKSRADGDKALYDALNEKLSAAGLMASVPPVNIRILDAARPPLAPAYPHRSADLALAALIGIALAIAAAVTRGRLSGTVLSGATIRQSAPLELAPLGVIPWRGPSELLPARENAEGAAAGAAAATESAAPPARSAVFDGFARLAANLTAAAGPPSRAILITSPNPGDGKTTIACGAAAALAEAGWRVLLVDADARRPGCHRRFGLENTLGLMAAQRAAAGEAASLAAITPAAARPRLDLLPCESDPRARLRPRALRELFAQWRRHYDFILVDSPPGNLTGDAVLLAGLVDGVALVARWSSTNLRELLALREDLHRAGSPLLGSIVNGADLRAPEFRYVRRHRAYFSAAA